MYPLVQAYDSVQIKSDVELGGTDQTFNILLGRDFQRHFNQEPQVALFLPILEGLDGVKKMSKSLGNYIGVEDDPVDIFGKVMSVSDELMWKYFTLLSSKSEEEISGLKSSHPMDVKKNTCCRTYRAFIRQRHRQFSTKRFRDQVYKKVFSRGCQGGKCRYKEC